MLEMYTVAPTSLARHMNAEGDDMTDWELLGGGMQSFEAIYSWDSLSEGDGFAWSGLAEGDEVTFSFGDMQTVLDPENPFQFVTYGDGGWQVAATGDFSEGEFDFSFTVVAVPAPGAISLLAVALVAAVSRRPR